MKMYLFALIAALALPLCLATSVLADAQWIGGGGDDLWSNSANWDPAAVPASATDKGVDDANVARMPFDGTTTLIEAGIDATAFGVQIGHPKEATLGDQSASNTLNMTGGTLTSQGNFLVNVGRGRNADPNQLAQFNVSGGVVNAAGITIPEGFNPDNVLGFTSVGINAEMHVSGNAEVRTDLLRLGAHDSNVVMTISDDARVLLTDENNGFANGVLWLEAFEFTPGDISGVRGTSVLDLQGNAQLRVYGEWWTDENGDTMRGNATATELQYYVDNFIGNGWMTAEGGSKDVLAQLVGVDSNGDGVMVFSVIPEPTTLCLAALACPCLFARRKRA
jgi:hypothetical protein